MRTIATRTARRIAADWYSPRALGLVALATGRGPLTDAMVTHLINDVDREIDLAQSQGIIPADLHKLRNWALAEARTRHLVTA